MRLRTTQQGSVKAADFFPMAVWYGGGKARAPMLERDARSKKETWRKDVEQIKSLGFNTVRAWIDWASGEPSRGSTTSKHSTFCWSSPKRKA